MELSKGLLPSQKKKKQPQRSVVVQSLCSSDQI